MVECKRPKCQSETNLKFPVNLKITPGREQFPNPGTVANLHKKTRDIIPEFFDGIEFSYKKGLAPNKTLLTNWILSHTYPAGFRVGGIYSYRCLGDIIETPTIEADINPSSLSANLSILYYPFPWLKIFTKFQRLDRTKVFENTISLEYSRGCSAVTISAYNPTVLSGRATLSVMRSLTHNFALGGELLFEYVGKERMLKYALAARYSTDRYSLATTLSLEGIDISYWRQVHRCIQMGSSLVFHKRTNKAIGSIFYQWEFKDATVRGMFDSDWSVGGKYNRTLKTLPCSVGVSLLLCIPSNRFAFGITLDVDPSVKCRL